MVGERNRERGREKGEGGEGAIGERATEIERQHETGRQIYRQTDT